MCGPRLGARVVADGGRPRGRGPRPRAAPLARARSRVPPPSCTSPRSARSGADATYECRERRGHAGGRRGRRGGRCPAARVPPAWGSLTSARSRAAPTATSSPSSRRRWSSTAPGSRSSCSGLPTSWGRATASCPTCCATWRRARWRGPGTGPYRMQPIAVRDAAALVLAASRARRRRRCRRGRPPRLRPRGPRARLLPRPPRARGRVARAQGKAGEFRCARSLSPTRTPRPGAGGWHGMPPDDLDCLLCDEVSDPRPSRRCWAASSLRSTRRWPRRCGRLEPLARAAHGRAAGGRRRPRRRPGRAGRGPRAGAPRPARGRPRGGVGRGGPFRGGPRPRRHGPRAALHARDRSLRLRPGAHALGAEPREPPPAPRSLENAWGRLRLPTPRRLCPGARSAGGDGPRGQRGCAARRRLWRRVPRPLHAGGKIRRARVRRRLLGGGRWRGRARRAVASPGRPRRGPGVALFEGSAVVELTTGTQGVHARTAHGSLRAAAGVVALGAQTRYPGARARPRVRFLRGASACRQPGRGSRPPEPRAHGRRRFRVAHGLGLARGRVRLAHEQRDLGFVGAKLREPRLLPGSAPPFATAPSGPLLGHARHHPGRPSARRPRAGLSTRGHGGAGQTRTLVGVPGRTVGGGCGGRESRVRAISVPRDTFRSRNPSDAAGGFEEPVARPDNWWYFPTVGERPWGARFRT